MFQIIETEFDISKFIDQEVHLRWEPTKKDLNSIAKNVVLSFDLEIGEPKDVLEKDPKAV